MRKVRLAAPPSSVVKSLLTPDTDYPYKRRPEFHAPAYDSLLLRSQVPMDIAPIQVVVAAG